MEIGGTAIAGAGAAVAAAAYIDARFHLTKDISDMLLLRKWTKHFGNQISKDRLSLWYGFEDQVKRMPANEECLWSRAGSYTWAETHTMACRYSQFLLSQGIQPGELVAFYLINSPEFVFSYLATWAIGTAPALINYNLGGDALIHCLKLSGSKVVMVDEDAECRARIEESRSRIEGELGMKIVIMDHETRQMLSTMEAKRPEHKYRAKLTPRSPMCLLYTSGTTGLPKAVAFDLAKQWNITHFRQAYNGLKTGPGGDRWYDTMPYYHGTGNTVLVGCLCAGLTLCIGRKFSVSRFWEDVRDSKATALVYVGETARYLVNAPPNPRDRDHRVKLAYGNGMRPDVWEKFRERFGIATISEFFNSSEGVFALSNWNAGPYTASAVGHDGAIKRWMMRNVYVPLAIDHEKGDIWRDSTTGFAKRMPYEEGGELVVKVPDESAFIGYWNNPEATKKKFLRDVFQKGDLYYRTGDALRRVEGKWMFMDRLGDTFRWKGENVSTAEVAECLGKFPGVAEANVYGVELPSHDGRAGCAALYIEPTARASFDYQGLLSHARKSLPKYAVPLFLRLIHEQNLGHNNKQNKVPLRNEGVDLGKVQSGQAGPKDQIMWVAPQGKAYVPFAQADWDNLEGGRARL